MKSAVERVAQALRAQGIDPTIVEFAESTRTAEEAARAVGTPLACIVKSLVFLADSSPILVLVSGSNRVSTARLGEALGATIGRAGAAAVRDITGYAIGGVPPVGHATPLPVICDRDLLAYATVYAAAGTPNAVFPIAPHELARITAARIIDLKDDAQTTELDQASG